MPISVFDLFSIGIGPSSSHTVGPMRFAAEVADGPGLAAVDGVAVDLYGSLAATGSGHGTPGAVLLGLEGHLPETVDPAAGRARLARIDAARTLRLGGTREIPFAERDIVLRPLTILPRHPNAVRLRAFGPAGAVLLEAVYYSVGGGFVVRDGETAPVPAGAPAMPYPFTSSAELLALCARHGASMADVVRANERAWRTGPEIHAGLLRIWHTMRECIRAGCTARGTLPGALGVRRRAADWYRKLAAAGTQGDPAYAMEWLNLAAMAVNEENAAGGRIVTAPTNGAAGIVPAVLYHATHHVPAMASPGDARDGAVVRFLLTAGAIGMLYKERASISGAEVGCQGEVGSACSMAAAGLAAVLGGTPAQVENAAEIGMEHHLGLTCDPVAGLVQIPCIERNAIAAVQAVNAARMALHGDGSHRVSLDEVIETMRQTGLDMSAKYKETSTGGLAVNVVEC